MVFLELQDERIAQRLQQVAQQHGQSIDTLLSDWLETFETDQLSDETETAGQKLARLAAEANLQFVDAPENGDYDAYLRDNFADDLVKRMAR